ncbi:hypothetical protein pb186bvf_002628 [Paramecium bursaria]
MQQIISEAYLKQLRLDCINQSNRQNINVTTFLYESILNKEYGMLIQGMDQQQIQTLNLQISRTILFGHQFANMQNAFNLIGGFIYFYIGSQIQITNVIQHSNNIWDQFVVQCLEAIFTVNKNVIEFGNLSLKLNIIPEFLQKIIEKLSDFNQIIQLLIFVVEKDIQLDNPIKRNHLRLSFNFIEAHGHLEQINNHQVLMKFNILKSILNNDYQYLKTVNMDAKNIDDFVQITYSFITLDHKQFQIILSRLSKLELQKLIQKQVQTQKDLFRDYYQLVLFGRCLKSLQNYDHLIQLYEKLKQTIYIQNNRKRYLIYIYYVLAKCYLLFNKLIEALLYAEKAIELIESFQKDNLLWYRQKQDDQEYCQLLLIRLFLRYINNDYKGKDFQHLYSSDKNRIKEQMEKTDNLEMPRSFKLIYQILVKFLKKKKILQNKVDINRYYEQIRLNLILNQDISMTEFIDQLFQFICITFIVQQFPYYVLYLEKKYILNYINLLWKIPDLISKPIQAQLFFQIGYFEQSITLAKQENIKKLIADYYFYKQDEQALNYYQQVKDADSYFQIANIFMNQQEYKSAYKYYKRAQKMSKDYLAVYYHKTKILSNFIEIKGKSQILKQSQTLQSQPLQESIFRRSFNFQSSLQFSNIRQDRQCKLIEQKRDDIEFLKKEVMTYFAPEYNKLIEAVEQFIIITNKFPCNSNYLQENVKVIGLLGRGGQCRVNKIRFDDQILASKISHVTFNPIKNIINEDQCIQIYQRLNEFNILSQVQDLQIPYVMQNLHIGIRFRQLSYDGLRQISIFNICPLYKPFKLIIQQSNQVKVDFAEKVAICLKLLQVNKISHQDVKPENILVDEDLNPVLIDFGISIMNFTSNIQKEIDFLTQIYADPMLIEKNQQSRKNDVYSYGILLYDLFTGRRPYDDIDFYDESFLNYKTHKENIDKIQIPQIQYLIQKCASHSIDQRYSFSQILFHFLLMKECRQDVLYLIQCFFIEFQQVDFTYDDYLLIKEFIAISLQYELIDEQNIVKLIQVSDEIIMYQSQQQLICHIIKIELRDNKYINILKIINVIVNFFHLSKKSQKVDKTNNQIRYFIF